MEASTSQARWELENDVQITGGADGFFTYNAAEQQAIQQQKPWTKDPQYFQKYVFLYCILQNADHLQGGA